MLLSWTTEQIEKLSLRTSPKYALALFAKLPPSVISGLQRQRFRQTLKLASRTQFYGEQFRRRNIDIRKIKDKNDNVKKPDINKQTPLYKPK